MKCINGVYWCSQIGLSGGKPCCGYLLAVGETKFINYIGIINEPCPLLPADTEEEVSDSEQGLGIEDDRS